jgi:hypothetical protein
VRTAAHVIANQSETAQLLDFATIDPDCSIVVGLAPLTSVKPETSSPALREL